MRPAPFAVRFSPLVVGLAILLQRTPALAADPPPPISVDLHDLPLYGDKDGLVYLRDPHDYVRLYPHAQVDLDAHGFFGSRVDTLPASVAGVDLGTRFLVRRARLELGGEIFERFGFDVGIDLAANAAIEGARVDGRQRIVALSDAWTDLNVGRGAELMMGVFQAPFSLENRTAPSDLSMMERNVAIRGFAMPGGKALGASLGGSEAHHVLHWDVGAFGAQSLSPGEFERRFDAIGRVYTRPLAGNAQSSLRGLQFGLSARAGSRLPRDVSDDTAAINSGQGFSLWRPTRIDALGRTIHVIDSGGDYAAGLELRIPCGSFDFRSEAYYVSRSTREAVDGYQSTNTERLGLMRGVGWYAQLSYWPLGSLLRLSPPDLGNYPHMDHLELARTAPKAELYGFELALLGAGVNARYEGAARGGAPDPSVTATGIEIYQAGAAVNYWYTKRFRLSANGNLYYVPGAATSDNQAVVPGNLAATPSAAQTLWEVGVRTTVMF